MHIVVVLLLHVVLLICFLGSIANGTTDPNDFKILNDFKNGLQNSFLLNWPDKSNDPCGPPAWPHVYCSNGRVTQIQVQNLGLKGPLPQNFNQLDKLQNLGFQKNQFNGHLPSFSGLSNLQSAYLDFNHFDSIPSDFFHGLSNIRVLALDENPFNQTSGWAIPTDLAVSSQLVNFSCTACNIVGPLPDFFGKLSSLSSLRLSENRLNGELPSTFRNSMLQVLWLNEQDGGGMSGSIDVIGTMVGLTQVRLHGNEFTGPIPDNIGDLTSLKECNLNGNHLVGLIPQSLADLNLDLLDLSNNMFMGPIPNFKASSVSYDSNSFCQTKPGLQCAAEVTALLYFLHDLNYPEKLASSWTGNDPCQGNWWGVTCDSRGHVSIINLQRLGLNGTLSPSLGNLMGLREIHLEGNNLHGAVPISLTKLRFLITINLSGNHFDQPFPKFRDGVSLIIDNDPKLPDPGGTIPTHPPIETPNVPPYDLPPVSHDPPSDVDYDGSSSRPNVPGNQQQNSTKIIGVAACIVVIIGLASLLAVLFIWKKRKTKSASSGVVVHPKDSLDHGNMLKIAVVDSSSGSMGESGKGNMVISLEVLQKITNNFAKENEIGRGGFGVVYKGKHEDGTKLAVKRMECGAIGNKALDEFQSEIAVLSKVRHRHLVSLLGYCVSGNERLLVYEYMPQGSLSRHIFRWKSLNQEPLSWPKRISIALDVARGVDYLHNLAHQSFIHRDLKSANILLDDDFRAKVADFGLVKLAPDSHMSVATRLAGTFGYLAPEYAVTGKITTKVDVFSFGVVLVELLTGLVALDEKREEEKRYLVEWFWQIKPNKETLIASIDPCLDVKEDDYESIYIIAELAGHCTSRDPSHRPEMGHAVNVLGQLVDKWKPTEDRDLHSEANMGLPLNLMLRGWQQEEMDTQDLSGVSGDSEGSIPAKPSGFAESFNSVDAR